MKDRIKQWLDGKYSVSLTLDSREEVIDLISECFNDLAPQWVRIGGLDSLPPYEDSYWFEPYHFNEELKIKASGDIEWMPLPPSEEK